MVRLGDHCGHHGVVGQTDRREGMSAMTISVMMEKKNASSPQMNGERPLRRAMAALQEMIRIQMMNPMIQPMTVADEVESASSTAGLLDVVGSARAMMPNPQRIGIRMGQVPVR